MCVCDGQCTITFVKDANNVTNPILCMTRNIFILAHMKYVLETDYAITKGEKKR